MNNLINKKKKKTITTTNFGSKTQLKWKKNSLSGTVVVTRVDGTVMYYYFKIETDGCTIAFDKTILTVAQYDD